METGQSLRPPERSAADIARSLREEFARSLFEATGAQAQPDPVLAALFHGLAVQIDRMYVEADQVFFDAALNDLIRGLGMPPRLARPAQAIVQFSLIKEREPITPETELIGFKPTGEQIIFAPDLPVEIAPTELAFAAVYESGRLTTVPGARPAAPSVPIMPGGMPLDLKSAAPTIFLAFHCDAGHLSRLGVFLDTVPSAQPIANALVRSPWQLLDDNGFVSEAGLLRPARSRGGTQSLSWFRGGRSEPPSASAAEEVLALPTGPYGGKLWVFPEVPIERRWVSPIPPALKAAVPRLLPPGHEKALDRPLTWVQIPLPAGTKGLANALARVAINCVTVSNVEVWSERIDFDRVGSVVSHRPLGSSARHIMSVLSVAGEGGSRYHDTGDLDAPAGSGRYRYRGAGRFEFAPARHESGRFDTYTMLRLLYCDGENGNGVDAGEIKQIRTDLARNPIARVVSLTPTKGGAAPPPYLDARLRFAELLRTRERVVTASDIEVAAKAYEPLIRNIHIEAASEITESGLGLVTGVTVEVSKDDFADPEADFERLTAELQHYLEERAMIGNRIVVALRDVGRGR